MGRIIFVFIFLFTFLSQSYSQTYEEFFRYLIDKDSSVSNFIDADELKVSNRFNIQYENQNVKFLIGYDIEKEVKDGIKSGELKYSLKEEERTQNFSKVVFSVENLGYKKEFFFRSGKLISPIKYFTGNWEHYQSKYFDFLISDENLFIGYCSEKLDEYIGNIASLLMLSEEEKKELENKKILYVFCRNQDEIKSITGYASRGQYIINQDAVVTTYSCHFHEVSHFLINYKLKKLPLYTLSFVQEGFAVATGGRGGQSASVLLNVGGYLAQNNIADYRSLFEVKNFRDEDASISYPVAGLFAKYLFDKDMKMYLDFYKKFSGSAAEITLLKADDTEVINNFEKYLQAYPFSNNISFNHSNDAEEIITNKSFFLTPENVPLHYVSTKFREIFKDREYKGEKYYFATDTNEINIYNLYSNELLASYVNSFNPKPVRYYNGSEYKFYITKSLLDENIKDLKKSY